MKIVVLGDFGIDNYVNLNLTKVGGIAFNVCYNLSKISKNNKISLISCIGNSKESGEVFKIVKKLGIDISHLKKMDGSLPLQKIELKKGERAFVGYSSGVLKKFKLNSNDINFINEHDLVYIPLSDGLESLFEQIKSIKSKILKITDFSKDYESADYEKKENLITKNILFFDIVFIGGSEKNIKMLDSLSIKYPTKVIVLTMGDKGCIAWSNNKKYRQKAIKVKKIVDTTGTGDAFQASFIVSYFKEKDIQTSLQKASIFAAKTLGKIGSNEFVL